MTKAKQTEVVSRLCVQTREPGLQSDISRAIFKGFFLILHPLRRIHVHDQHKLVTSNGDLSL